MVDKETLLKNLEEMEDHGPLVVAQILIQLMKFVVLDEVRCSTFEEARRYIREGYYSGVDEVNIIVAPMGQTIEQIKAKFGVILSEDAAKIGERFLPEVEIQEERK